MLDVFQLDQPNFAVAQTNSIGIFSVNGLIFYDTAQFYIRPSSFKSQVGKIEILNRKPANIEFDDLNYSLNIVRTELTQRINSQNELIKAARLLKEVEVKAKRIIIEKPIDRVQRPYGRADYILKRKDLNLTYGNLLQTLPGKVPGLVVRQASNLENDAGPEWVVYISKGGNSSSFINVAQVLITINDVVVTGNPGQILSAIDPNTVESIEVKTGVNVLYGSLGGNGVVSIYTKMGFEDEAVSERKNIPKLKVAGYAGVRKFDHPIVILKLIKL
jgi:TonB-dependent Receptor Plug Domain